MALDLGIFLEGSQSTFKVKVSENDAQAQFLLDKFISSDGSVTITETNDGGIETIDLVAGGGSPLTTKGDLFTYSTADARLGVGADGEVLLADSAEATGLKWGTISADNMATADLTLTGNRTHDLAGFDLTITDATNGDVLKLRADGSFALGENITEGASAYKQYNTLIGAQINVNNGHYLTILGQGNSFNTTGDLNSRTTIVGSANSVKSNGYAYNTIVGDYNRLGSLTGLYHSIVVGHNTTTASGITSSNNVMIGGYHYVNSSNSINIGKFLRSNADHAHIFGGYGNVPTRLQSNVGESFFFGFKNGVVDANNSTVVGSQLLLSRFSNSWLKLYNGTNLGINTFSPTAKLTVKGEGSTNATSTLLIENSSGTDALEVRDDSIIIMANLPTSSAGLPTGALWNNSGVLTVA
jgi:hypothetical protein